MKLKSYEFTDVGPVRSENQDSIFSMQDRGVYLVADGMGGEKAGAEASAQVVESVKRVMGKFFDGSPPRGPREVEKTMRDALESANRDVYEISVREPEKKGLGSTGSLLVIHKGLYFVAQVGDSRVYLVREGNVRQITRDHTVVWTLYENGIITRDQLETHPERHLLTQCIGSAKPIQVDMFEDQVRRGDRFLVCSDGLTGYAGEDEVIRYLSDPVYDLEERASRMVQSAFDGGGGDNVSVMLIEVDDVAVDDDWRPDLVKPSAEKTMGSVEDSVTGIPTTRAPEPLPPQRGPDRSAWFAIGGAILILILAIIVSSMRGGTLETGLVLEPPVGEELPELDMETLDLEVNNQDWEPVEEPVTGIEGDRIDLKLPGKGIYRLRLDAPGLLEIPWREVDFDGGDPPELEVQLSGRLILIVDDIDALALLEVRRDDLGSDREVYRWTRPGEKSENADEDDEEGEEAGEDDAPRLEHDLQPEVQYQIEAIDLSGGRFTERIVSPPAGGSPKERRIVFEKR